MKLNRIFENVYSVEYEEKDTQKFTESEFESLKDYNFKNFDAFQRLQELWHDIVYLREFFTKYKRDYEGFFGFAVVNQIVFETIKNAEAFFELLDKYSSDDNLDLRDIFETLHNNEREVEYPFQKRKAKRKYLRIYAIIVDDCFVITGGTIKLTGTMKERQHTKDELYKSELVKEYLKENVTEGKDLDELVFDI